MHSIKKIAEDLQINCIIKKISNIIDSYESAVHKIDEKHILIDSVVELCTNLYNIKNIGIEKVQEAISMSIWSTSKENVQELAAFILQVISPNFFLHKEMSDLLIQLNHESNETNKLNNLMPFIMVDKISQKNFHFVYKKR